MAKRRRPPSQGWMTFVHNHADAIASIDMFVVPTISFGLVYGLLILRQSHRELLWLGVTSPSQCRMTCRQLTEACGWDNTTTRSERTYRCRRTRRFGVMRAEQGACVRRRSWAGYTINMFEFEFPTGTAG
jgi:hypothetical protein